MRTLSQMIDRVKVHVRAAENLTWAKDDYEAALVEAARVMWRHICDNGAGRYMRTFSERTAVPKSGTIDIPDDCIKLEEVRLVFNNGSSFMLLPYSKGYLDDERDYLRPIGVFRSYWTDVNCQERKIEVCNVRCGSEIVMQYVQEPVFPFSDNGTLRNPSGSGEDVYPSLPELADSALEYLASAFLLGEELRDDVPIGYCGQQYSSYLGMMVRGVSTKPARRYVRRVSGRR